MTQRTKVLTGPHRGLPISTHMPKRLTWLCIEWCYLTRDYAHDHWLGRADKDMMQSHCPEEPVRSRQAGIGVHNKGCALHEGPQVDIHVPLLISQVPAVTTLLQKAPHHNRRWPSGLVKFSANSKMGFTNAGCFRLHLSFSDTA